MTAVDAPANSVGGVQLVDIYIAPVGWDPYSNNPANECILSSTDNGKILSSSTISGMKEIFTTWAVATDL